MQTDREPRTADADSTGVALLVPAAVLLVLAAGIGSAQWWPASPLPVEPRRSTTATPGPLPHDSMPDDGFVVCPGHTHCETTAGGGSPMPPVRDTRASMR